MKVMKKTAGLFLKQRSRRQAGNAILMLFAAIGMAGVVTYGLNNILRGPALTASEVSRRTIAENNLVASTRLAVAGAVKNQANEGDCDGDGFVEPMPFRAGAGSPTGGGFLPMTMGASMSDPWGTQYGYCVWDPGTVKKTDNVAACGGSTANRLNGGPKDDQPAIAVISAGKNGIFETTCAAYVDANNDSVPDAAMLNKPAGSDDVVLSYTYAEANGIGAGEWKIKASDATTAEVAKDLTVGGGASFTGGLDASAGGLVLPKDPGDNTVTGPCTASNDQQLRLNMSANPPSLEMCNMAGGGWTVVSGGGASTPPDATCLFPPAQVVAEIDSQNTRTNHLIGNTLFSGEEGGGSSCVLISNDVTDPANPSEIQFVSNCTGINGSWGYANTGNMLYVANLSGDSVSVWDVTNPAAMAYRGRVTDAKLNAAGGIAVINPQYVIATAYDADRATVVNVSNPAAPSIPANGSILNTTYLDGPTDVVVSGNYAYVVGNTSDSVGVINVTDPTNPVMAGGVINGTSLADATYMQMKGNYLYVASELSYQKYLTVIDISNPTTPVIVASVNHASKTGAIGSMKIYGKYLFMNSNDGLHIWDLSDPVAPLYLRKIPANLTGDVAGGFAMKGHYGLFTTYDTATSFQGLRVLNLGCDPLTGEIDSSLSAEPAPAVLLENVDTGMIGYWKFDEGSGTVINDSIGSNAGSVLNFPEWLQGPNGASSLSFNMADRDAVRINGLMGQPTKGTISAWVNAEDYDLSGSTIFTIADYLGIQVSDTINTANLFFWDGTTVRRVESGVDLQGTGWHYITATWDDTQDTFRIYIDGRLMNQKTITENIVWTGRGTNTFIGRQGNGAATYDFQGGIDDVRLYSRALGPAEVAELYNRMRDSSTVRQLSYASRSYADGRIAASRSSTCAIKQDNSLWCWGDDSSGQVGNGPSVTGTVSSPSKVDNNSYSYVSGSHLSYCAIRTDGTLWCWGLNDTGQTGTGTCCANVTAPKQIAGGGSWMQVSAGAGFSCGIKTDSTLWCWGTDNNAVLGNGTGSTAQQNSPSLVGSGWKQVSAFLQHACGVKTDGSGWCWGVDSSNALGNGSASTATQASPSRVEDPGPWASIITGTASSTCGLKVDGTAWCWGTESGGEFGNTPLVPTSATALQPVNGGLQRFVQLTRADTSACAISTDGSAWCWGSESNGELGNGATITANIHAPAPLDGAKGWTSLSMGLSHACGLKSDGSAWCWGRDAVGTLGNGPALTADQTSPYPVYGFMDPSILGWNDALSIITGQPNYSMAINTSFLNDFAYSASGFGFTGPGKAAITQAVDSSQLLIQTTATNSSSQISLKTAPTATALDYTTSLVAKWTMDAASGTTTTSSPGAINGTLIGTPRWNPGYGRVDGSLYLDGATNGVSAPPGSAMTSITVAVWVKLDGSSQLGSAKFISKSWNNHGAPTYNTYSLGLNSLTSAFTFETGHASGINSLAAPNTVDMTGWVHLVGTYNPAAAAPQKKLYVNGVLVASATLTDALTYDNNATTGKLYLGQNGVNYERFKGQIDDVRIYNAALNDAAVAQMYTFLSQTAQVPRTMGIDYLTDNFVIGRNNAAASTWLNAISPDIAVTSAGLVGIGTGTPQATVDVNGGVRFGKDYECSVAAHAGKVRYMTGQTPPWQYCTGTAWTAFPSLSSSLTWRSIGAAGGAFGCGLKSDGSGYCWGTNGYGQLGKGTAGNVSVSTALSNPSDWKELAVGDRHTCGIKSNGTLWCWGDRATGKVGDGLTTPSAPDPVAIAAGTTWSHVAANNGIHTCALKSDGSIWCWGTGASGRLGNNSTASQTTPVQVHTNSAAPGWFDWVYVTAGQTHSCGIRGNGTAWCWGTGDKGELGDNQASDAYSRPRQVGTGGTLYTDWKVISAGDQFTCGVRANGTAWCWGVGDDAQLGNNTVSDATLPSQVTDTAGTGFWTDWTYITTGQKHACGLRSNGALYCWGDSDKGTTGNGANGTLYDTPQQVQTTTGPGFWSDWIGVEVGITHSCGVRVGGIAYCWGDEGSGALGNNSTSNEITRPVLVQ